VTAAAATLLAFTLTAPASGATGVPPDAVSQLERVSRFHAGLDRYAVEIRVRVDPGDSGAPTQVLAARTARRGPVMLQELSSFVVLTRPDLRLMVDRASRTIYLNAEPPDVPAALPGLDPAAALRAARERGYAVEARGVGDAVEVAFRPADAHPTVVFTFGRDEPRLRRMQLVRAAGVREGPARIEVDYRWRDPEAEGAAPFEAAHYVRRQGGAWAPAPAFAGYRVVDSRAR